MNRRQFIATATAALGATHVKAFLPTLMPPAEIEIYYETFPGPGRGCIICPPGMVGHYLASMKRWCKRCQGYRIVSIKPINKPKHPSKWSYVNV